MPKKDNFYENNGYGLEVFCRRAINRILNIYH